MHNIRTTNLNEGVIYAGIREDVVAIAVVYKWIAPFFEIYEDENQFCTLRMIGLMTNMKVI